MCLNESLSVGSELSCRSTSASVSRRRYSLAATATSGVRLVSGACTDDKLNPVIGLFDRLGELAVDSGQQTRAGVGRHLTGWLSYGGERRPELFSVWSPIEPDNADILWDTQPGDEQLTHEGERHRIIAKNHGARP